MFAVMPKKEITFRIILISVILFNAFLPSNTYASSMVDDTEDSSPTIDNAENDQLANESVGNYYELPLNFVANNGQFDKDVKFQTNSLGGSVFFTPSEVVLALMDKKIKTKVQEGDTELSMKDNSKVASIEFKNANNKPIVEGLELQSGTANFMVGSDKKAWVTNAPMYGAIVYRDLYAGIDLNYEGVGQSLKSTFTVQPGADPSTIQWRYKHSGEITLDESGDLLIALPAQKADQTTTTLVEHAPIAWQEQDGQRFNVPVQYTITQNGEMGFEFPDGYDTSLPLIIDPTLTYSTYLGDIGTDVGTAITTDSSGNVYVTGYSWCGDFPLVDPIQQGGAGGSEIIISKISADGSTLLYSTCIGGTGDDQGISIKLDGQNRIVVAGVTNSTDFPIVSGIGTYGGGTCTSGAPCQDSVILVLDGTGSTVDYSSYLGGDGREEVGGIAIDSNNNIIIVGSSTSTNYPTVNAYDSTFGGGTCTSSWPCYDVTVTKIDPDLSGSNAILYSTYLGGDKRDKAYGLVLDSSNIVSLVGYSDSDGYPVRNALQSTRGGSNDIIVSKVDTSLVGNNSLLYSTYLGSSGTESGFAIASDASGDIYVTGTVSTTNFPLRDPLQYQSHESSCGSSSCYEAFVTKLDVSTNTLVYSTYLGGSYDDEGYGIAVDSYGRAYVVGYTLSTDFPTYDPIQATKGADGCSSTPCSDAFLSVIEPDGQAFAYSTFLGGDQDDVANGITIDAANNVFVVGETYSTNFPTTYGAYDVINTETNKRDAFITKIAAIGPFSPSTSHHVDVPIASGSDDAEEYGSGSMSLTSATLDLVDNGSSVQTVGLRFTDVNIPYGAVIENAWIQFATDAVSTDVTSLTIRAEAVDNASTFTTVTEDISLRPKTSANITWIPATWNTDDEAGPDQRTPSLVALVQDVVNRPGWAEGNALAFIVTGSGRRIAKSYERDVYGAPYLHIEYSDPTGTPPPPGGTILTIKPDAASGEDTYLLSSSGSSNYGTSSTMGVGENNNSNNKFARSLIKFDLSSIPANATITSATLSLWTSNDYSSNDSTVRVYRLKVPFNETQATWNVASIGVNWQSPGASGTNDRENVDIGSMQILADEPLGTEEQIQLSPAKIQEMIDGSFTNNGFILVTDTELNDRFDYKTSDTSTVSQRPKLVIHYTTSGSSPTATFTPTPTQTLTPTPTSTLTPTATFTPSPTYTPTQVTGTPTLGPVSLNIDSPESYAVPGGTTVINWHVATGFDLATRPVTLKLYAPGGFTPMGSPGTFDPITSILTLDVTTSDGQVNWQVDGNAGGPYLVTARLFENAQEYADTSITLDRKYEFNSDQNGGQYATGDGEVVVDMPAGAISTAATILIGDPGEFSQPDIPLSENIFEVQAIDQSTGQEIHSLAQSTTIQVNYSEDIPADAEGDLALYYYNPGTELWERLASSVDTVTNTLTAETDHFSVFDIKVEDWQASDLPTVANFQVSQFTGAATYSVGLEVPPGPAGLQPSLSVSYNSQTVDGGSSITQASWVGMGWSLDTGYIERDTNGTPSNYNDDTYTVVYGGVSSLLLHDGAGVWHVADENFWHAEKNGETWYLWDKSGNKFTFGEDNGDRGLFAACQGGKPWRYALSRVTNIYSQSLTYDYVKDSKTITGCTGQMDTAIYPSTITYPHGRYRVYFVTTDRGDYDPSELSFFNKKKLSNVIMQWDSTGSGNWQPIRSYHFSYYNDDGQDVSKSIYPNYVWKGPGASSSIDKHTLTLMSIQELGSSSGTLPATTFEYGDGMHLTHANNGFDATVDYSYEMWYDKFAPASTEKKQDFGANKEPCGANPSDGALGKWGLRNNDGTTSTNLYCQNGKLLTFREITNTTLGTEPFKPGRLYKIKVQAKAGTNTKVTPNITGSWLDLGLFDNAQNNYQLGTLPQYYAGSYYANRINLTGTSQTYEVFRYLPATASKLNLLMNTNGAELDYYSIVPVPTYYRVIAKTIDDGNPNTPAYAYSYEYAGAATNNESNSTGVTTSNPLQEKYSEFRGHRTVIETGPDGKQVIITWYNQGDALKGREERAFVTEALGGSSYKVYTENSSAYSIVDLTTGTGNMPIKNGSVVTDQAIRWLRADSTVSCSYDTSGAGIAYAYDGSTPTGGTCVYQDAIGANTVGQRTVNEYAAATAYGNLLRSTVQYWNGTAWANYRAVETSYNPRNTITSNGDGVYLVDFPATEKVFGCDISGTCTTLLGANYNYYDGATDYSTAPTQGKLTRSRTWLDTVSGVDQYSQTDLSNFDSWGNAGTTTTYDGYITLASTGVPTGARSQTTTYDTTYGSYVRTSTNPLGPEYTTTMDYDYKMGVVVALHDINDRPGYPVISTATYDQFGRIKTVILPGDTAANPSISMDYYDNERPFRVKISQWIEDNTYFNISRTYDGVGRMIRMTTIGAKVEGVITDINTDFAYDEYDRVVSQTVPYTTETNPPTTTTLYDVLGRTIKTTGPNGDHVDTSYSNVTNVADPLGGGGLVPGQQTTVKDAADRITTSISDPLGRAISVTPPLGPGVTYTYDQMDQLKTALYAGETTTLNYDVGGRKTSMNDPAMGDWIYEYDALGNMTKQTDARLCVSTMTYDLLDRLKDTTYSGPETGSKKCSASSSEPIHLTYDQGNDKGRLNSISDASGTRSWVYDVRGRVMIERYSIDSTFTFDITHTYAADQLKTTTYPDGEVVSYTYTPQKLLDGMSSALGTYVQSETYDASGRATSRVLGANLLTNIYNYNAWTEALGPGRLNGVTLKRNSDNVALQNLGYTYDAGSGNIHTITDALAGPQTQTFGYDDLDRLTSASALGGTDGTFSTELYEYDSVTGDLKKKANVDLNYDDPNHAHAVTSTDTGTNAYTYDENGNQITRTIAGDGTYTLYYDASNHLVQVDKVPSGGGATVTTNYIYDGQGKLVVKKTATDETVYVGEFYERTFPLVNGAPVDDSPVPFGTILPFADSVCPTGWNLVSGVSTDILYNRFPQGADTGATPGVQGGSDTHTHVYTDVPQHSHTGNSILVSTNGSHTHSVTRYDITGFGNYPQTGTGNGNNGSTASGGAHTHDIQGTTDTTGTSAPTTDPSTVLPPYLDMLFCRKSVIDSQGVPVNAVAIFDYNSAQQLPDGWVHFTALDGKFPRGAAVYGGTGGSTTHNHGYSQIPAHYHLDGSLALSSSGAHSHGYTYYSNGHDTSGNNLQGTTNTTGPRSSSLAVSPSGSHSHTLSGQTDSAGISGTLYTDNSVTMPPYQEVPYAQKTVDDGLDFPIDSIMIWEGTVCPTTWERYTPLDGKFPLGAGYVNTTGGAATHTHTYSDLPAHSHGVSNMTVTSNGQHTHNLNFYQYGTTSTISGRIYGSDSSGTSGSNILKSAGSHTHSVTGSTSETGVMTPTTQSASNLPPYTTFVYCKKVSTTQSSGGANTIVRKYYFSGTQRVAMRENNTLYFLAGDHLGSTSIIIDAAGNKVGEMRYKPWGEERYSWSSLPNFPTDYQYTGQRNNTDIGLYYYGARWYDASLSRFVQADTIIPDGVLGWDRFAYVKNNPVLYNDPSGHDSVISQFLAGFTSEIVSSVLWFSPKVQQDLAPNEHESVAMLTGRVVGDIVSTVVGVAAIGGGGTAIGGGTLCVGLSVGGCLPAGAPTAVAGAALVVEGAGMSVRGALGLGSNLVLLAKKVSEEPTGKRPNWRSGYSKQDFIDRYGDRCPYCGEKMTPEDLSRDHVTPWDKIKQSLKSRSQEINVYHDWTNLVGACKSCNSSKKAQTLLEYMYKKLMK